jgi:hypothetical protein
MHAAKALLVQAGTAATAGAGTPGGAAACASAHSVLVTCLCSLARCSLHLGRIQLRFSCSWTAKIDPVVE